MKSILKSLILAAVLCAPANALAYGTFTLTAAYGGNTQVLSIEEVNGYYQGTLTTNGVVQDIFASYSPIHLSLIMGSDVWSFEYVKSSTATSFISGLGPGGRAIEFFGTYKTNRSVWLYDGTIGPYDDFTGKGQADQLDLSWGKTKLKIQSTGSGNCSGEARIGGTTTHVFSCTSSGSLADGLFLQPDQVLAWIVSLYVK